MGIYSRKEFAALCHTSTAVITTNINRDKVVLNQSKKIDSENPINNAFFERYQKKHEVSLKLQKNKAQKNEVLYNKVVEKVKETPKEKKEREEANAEAQLIVDWDLRKKKAETLLKERQAEKEQMQLDKLAGKLLPTDLTYQIVRIHNTSIFASFHNDIENQASIFADILAGGDRKKLGKLNEKLAELLSSSIEKAKEMAELSIKNAVKEYSKTRNRGERK